MTDNEIANEYKMYTPQECLQKIVDQHKEINRQKAKIDMLEKQLDDKCDRCIAMDKADAYKECIEKAKNKILPMLTSATLDEKETICFCLDKLDNLLKELVAIPKKQEIPATPTNHSKRKIVELARCSCGGEAEFVKLTPNRYGGFIRCTRCGKETKAYTSKQNAVKAWKKINCNPEEEFCFSESTKGR